MTNKYASMNGSFAENIRDFAERAKGGIDTTIREIVIEIGSSVIRMSPVGNPEIWAANVTHRQANTRAADDYDFKVAVRNTIINLNESNFTKAGKLRKGVKYAKPTDQDRARPELQRERFGGRQGLRRRAVSRELAVFD